MGKPPTIGEVFIRTPTKNNGTFVDRKAQEVHEAYKTNKTTKLAALENYESFDGTSSRSEISQEEDDEIFRRVMCFFIFVFSDIIVLKNC